MDLILHLPQDIDKNGALWHLWNNFCNDINKFQNTKLQETAYLNASSLLLFAAHDQINFICSSLKMYNIDLPQLNQILQVVEQACLPYFILLFERFKYFSLKHEPSDSLDEFAIILRKQKEYCELGNFKESMISAIDSSLKCESHLSSSTDGLNLNNLSVLVSEPQRSHTTVMDVNVDDDDKDTTQADNIRLSSEKHKSIGAHISCSELQTKRHISKKHYNKRKKHNISARENIGKLTKKLNILKSNTKIMPFRVESHKKSGKLREKTDLKKIIRKDKVPSSPYIETNTGSLKLNLVMATEKTEAKLISPTKLHCCFCDKSFAGQNCFRKHLVLKHKGCTQFKCKWCANVFFNVDEYLLHYNNKHFVQQQKPQSKTTFPSMLKVKRNAGKFNCTLCRRVFVKEGYLRRHIHYSHAKNFLCWSCGENIQSLLDYKQHSEKHIVKGRFICNLCQRPHHNVFRLIGHLKNHLMPQNKCEICGVVFIKQESLSKHVEKHMDEPAHKCTICGKNFAIEARLQSHMRTHSGEKRFTCELCGKMYAQKINLVHHKRWHTGERPYECEICGKRSRSSGDLSKHKRKHSDKYSYVCEVCGRGFNYSSALVKHRLGHTGKRSYVCEVCGRTFIYREGLRDHIKAQRCPGRRSESGYNRTPRATKLLQSGISNSLMDVVESKVFAPTHAQKTSDASLKDVQDWHCMLRNNETDGGTSVVLVPSFY